MTNSVFFYVLDKNIICQKIKFEAEIPENMLLWDVRVKVFNKSNRIKIILFI